MIKGEMEVSAKRSGFKNSRMNEPAKETIEKKKDIA